MIYTKTPKHLIVCFTFMLISYHISAIALTNDISNSKIYNFSLSNLNDAYTSFDLPAENNCSETAYAFLNNDDDPTLADSQSHCFIPQFSRWGWTSLLDFSEETGQSSYDLAFYSGAGQCDLSKGTDVGIITVTYNNDSTITFDYTLHNGYLLSEAHIYVGSAMYPIGNNGSETVAPGRYTFKESDFGEVQNYSATLPVDSQQVYIIVHGVTHDENCFNDDDNDDSDDDDDDDNDDDDTDDCTDSDGDSVCDSEDICPGSDDNVDSDGDGIPDGCDSGGGVFRNATFKAYPVPFNKELTVQYEFDYDTDVTIEVFNTRGLKITELKNSNYSKGTLDSTKLNLSSQNDQLFFIKLTTAKRQFTKKVVSTN